MFCRTSCISLNIMLITILTVLVSVSSAEASSRHISQPHSIRPSVVEQTVVAHKVSTTTVPRSGRNLYSPFVPLRPGPANNHHISAPHYGAIPLHLPKGTHPNTATNISFAGQTDTSEPVSDTNAAPGPYNIVETVNDQWAVYDRSGNQQYLNTFDKWFGVSVPIYQPKAILDPWSPNFIFMATDGSSFYISLSLDPGGNALGNWCNYVFPSIAGFAADAPQLGVDQNYVYFTANLYDRSSDDFVSSEIFQADKNSMEHCQTSHYSFWTNLQNPDGSPAFTIVPAVEQKTFTGTGTEYLVNSHPYGGYDLTLWSLAGQSLSNTSISTQGYATAPPVPQASSNGTLEVPDDRLTQASLQYHYLSTAIASGYNWGVGEEAIIEWFQIDVSANRVYQQGGFGKSGSWLFCPAIQQDNNGNFVIIFDISDSSMYPSIWYAGLSANGNLNGTNILANGKGRYGTSGLALWGQYQSAWIDPNNPARVWIAGQYGATSNAWGTWIGQVQA